MNQLALIVHTHFLVIKVSKYPVQSKLKPQSHILFKASPHSSLMPTPHGKLSGEGSGGTPLIISPGLWLLLHSLCGF